MESMKLHNLYIKIVLMFGKLLATALLMLSPMPILAADVFLQANGASVHFDSRANGKAWNAANYGGGVSVEFPKGRSVPFLSVGAMENSVDRPAAYIGGGWRRRFGSRFQIDAGLFAGAVYYEQDDNRHSTVSRSWLPAVLPMISLGPPTAKINAVYIPKINSGAAAVLFSLQVKVR